MNIYVRGEPVRRSIMIFLKTNVTAYDPQGIAGFIRNLADEASRLGKNWTREELAKLRFYLESLELNKPICSTCGSPFINISISNAIGIMKNIYICKCSDVYDALITSQEKIEDRCAEDRCAATQENISSKEKISCEDSGFELAGHV